MQLANLRSCRLHLSRDDLRENGRQPPKPEVLDQAERPLRELGIEATAEDRRVDVDAERSHEGNLSCLSFLCA